jgi:PAS domain S-box-containing protein
MLLPGPVAVTVITVKGRRQMAKGEKSQYNPQILEVILESIADGVFTVDKNFKITSFNHAAEEITGVPVNEALGRYCYDVFKADICESDCALHQAMENDKPLMRYPISIIRADGNKVSVSITASALRNRNGSMGGGVETFHDLSLIEELRRKVQGIYSFEDIVSRNKKMAEIFSILPRIAKSDSTVLIDGESGTGKEVIATALHNLSQRSKGPMVVVNCGAIPDTLLESELFGYVAGAFTDAKKDKPGRFAQADGGTILLDEIGDVSPALQTRLLRVLQEKSFEPLGSTKTDKTNVRVLAATNKNLSDEVEAGRFRRDLYYRINVIGISLPPLRERKEDIPLLADSFIHKMNLISNKSIKGLSPRATKAFMDYEWPGNIRELENAIEHAFILCEDNLIRCDHLPNSITCQSETGGEYTTGKSLQEIEARAIYDALVRHNWNKSAAARELGLDKSTIWRKCKNLGIMPPGTK